MFRKLIYMFSLIVMLIIITTLNAQIDPGTENLTHSWTFNNGTANDHVGGASGTLKATAEIVDGSLLLANPGSWMELPAENIAINTYDEVTLEAWFLPFQNANTGYTMLVCFGRTVNNLGVDYYFFGPARGDNKSRAAISCGVTSSPWTGESGADGPELDDGELHHLVSTLNTTDITLYLDGELKASTPLDTNNSIDRISTNFAALAKSNYNGDSTWMGEVHEFNIYNRALSAEEALFLFNKGENTSAVEKEVLTLPGEYRLLQNYPNPFNSSTKIFYELSRNSEVTVKVYDLNGREMATLVKGIKSAGQHGVQFNGGDLSTGIYICRMIVANTVISRKMILLK